MIPKVKQANLRGWNFQTNIYRVTRIRKKINARRIRLRKFSLISISCFQNHDLLIIPEMITYKSLFLNWHFNLSGIHGQLMHDLGFYILDKCLSFSPSGITLELDKCLVLLFRSHSRGCLSFCSYLLLSDTSILNCSYLENLPNFSLL